MTNRIPPEVSQRLSSADLSDIPPAIAQWSPLDASDEEVRQHLATVGFLSRGTNYGVVYRACFEPMMFDADEEPLYLRTAFAAIAQGDGWGEMEQSWLLVTSRAIRWHVFTDRVPGMPARFEIENLTAPLRELFYERGYRYTSSDPQRGPADISVRPLLVDVPPELPAPPAYLFLIPADASTDALIEYVEGHYGS